jgi:hypothetical protein
MGKATDRALSTSAAVAHGVEMAAMVSATAAEALRTRRDPAVVAQRKVKAARRRVRGWTAGAVVSGALAATGTVTVIDQGPEAGAIGAMVLLIALFVWCVVGIVRAAVDLRARKAVLAALPVASPKRPAVAGEIRPEMARLDGYSDGLRQLVGMIGIVEDEPGVRALRDEIISAADTSEATLRRQALDLTGLIKAQRTAPPAAKAQLDGPIDALRQHIRQGVTSYGDLVSAASEAVAASRQLADQAGGSTPDGQLGPPGSPHPELGRSIDQLRSLAAGMRELTGG